MRTEACPLGEPWACAPLGMGEEQQQHCRCRVPHSFATFANEWENPSGHLSSVPSLLSLVPLNLASSLETPSTNYTLLRIGNPFA
jgi:hypothetical protein